MDAEKENTFRALREQDLLVTSLWCRFGLHRWTKYREPERIKEGYYALIVQQRRCSSCNIADKLILSKE